MEKYSKKEWLQRRLTETQNLLELSKDSELMSISLSYRIEDIKEQLKKLDEIEAKEQRTIFNNQQEMNESEKDTIKASVDLWNQCMKLEKYHPDDINDIRFHINAIQNIIMSRETVRNHPELFIKIQQDK